MLFKYLTDSGLIHHSNRLVSVSKCNLLTVGPSCYEADYHINGTQLPKWYPTHAVTLALPLRLTCRQHNIIHHIALKVHQRANHIIRCFISGYITLLVKAFTVYVHQILEYNSIIWSPCTKKRNRLNRESAEAIHKAITWL